MIENVTVPPGRGAATYVKRSVRETVERFVRTSSVENALVSTTTGRVVPVIEAAGLAGTGSTNEPSEFAWSLMTP